MPYTTARGLEGLKQYQYKSGGYTWLDDLHQPFWNGITELLPRWVAPNLITMAGTIGLVVAYLVHLIYLPDLQGDAPRWVFFLGGFAVLSYLHLDCIDGKQARRTKSSSPLGQLFDHGCDALSVHLIVTNLAGSLGMGLGWRATLFSMGVMGPWALAHWEEYHSGIMLYGNPYWGVTEANYLVVAGHFLSALFGAKLWEGDYRSILGWQLPYGLSLRRGDLNLVLVLYGGVQQSFGCIYRTFIDKDIKVPLKERGHKRLGHLNASWQLLQLQVLFILGPWTTLEKTDNAYHTRLLMANYGIAYSLEMSRLIMSHMSKEPFHLAYWPLAAMAATLVNSYYPLLPAFPLASFVGAILLAGYLHYVSAVVKEICDYLHIKCFTIPLVPEDRKE